MWVKVGGHSGLRSVLYFWRDEAVLGTNGAELPDLSRAHT